MFTLKDYILIACALAVFGGIVANTIFIAVLVYRGARSKPVPPRNLQDPDVDPALPVRNRLLSAAASDPLD